MRALVIDDSRAMRRIVTGILEGLGYEVQPAGHGREGLDVLDTGWVPDLVCVDWNMPVMDGLQFVSAVRANPAWRSVTIMMVTSESEHTQIVRALAAGAHEYVIKPFTADAIRDKLALLGLLPGGRPVSTIDTGERRRGSDARPVITELIDEATIQSIADDAWTALVGEDELLLPLPGELPADVLSSWVDVVGPWTGSVVLTTGRQTAADLTRALLGETAPELLEYEDVADAFGEIANVVGGNIKAALPGPSGLSLPDVGDAPGVRNPADVCRLDVLWRGQPLTISVQGALPPLPVAQPHNEGATTALPENGASL